MTLWAPQTAEVPPDRSGLDAMIDSAPPVPGVFAIWPREGQPYAGRTTLLRRRLGRLLRERSHPSRLLNLRDVVRRIEYQPTASWLETTLVFREVVHRYFPESYQLMLKLRMPPYIKIILSNPFPRSQVTNRLGSPQSLYYGPFRTRASAEEFESRFLDLFQLRRCTEDLVPSPEHPGCMYGEMNLCLRPCQAVVTLDGYRSEAARVVEFLSTDGHSLLETVLHARDRLSQELNFEGAAEQHRSAEKIRQVLKLRDELVRDIDKLHGVAVTPSVAPECVELWFVIAGAWQPPRRLSLSAEAGIAVSLDKRLREIVEALSPARISTRERQEDLALLARWFYASGRKGEWIPFESMTDPPYRRIVNAISRVAHPKPPAE